MIKGTQKTTVSSPDYTVSMGRAEARFLFLLLWDSSPDSPRNSEHRWMLGRSGLADSG